MEDSGRAKAKAVVIDIDDEEEEEEELKSVLNLHRQQLMEAKTVESDLDLAFELQMQEALTASLSHDHHPSTSQGDTVLPPTDTDFDYLTLMLEDIDRLETERQDMEVKGEEMRKLKDDLNRSIHDQNFARYIMDVPESEWNEYGNNYERPYNGNAGTSVISTELFKVYVKDLISEEWVRDMKVTVGGVGVAVCDFRDNLVLEVRKKLEGAELMTGEMAGVEAVAHGLNAALSLDLKRVTVFVDDYLVHQYVSLQGQGYAFLLVFYFWVGFQLLVYSILDLKRFFLY